MGDQQVKFNVFNALKYPDDFQSCQMIEDITHKKTRPTSASLEDEAILNKDEDGEEEGYNIISDPNSEKLDRSNKSTTKIKPSLEQPQTLELET